MPPSAISAHRYHGIDGTAPSGMRATPIATATSNVTSPIADQPG